MAKSETEQWMDGIRRAGEEARQKPRTVKVRIAVAVDSEGNWSACGWNDAAEDMLLNPVLDTLGPVSMWRWITAELPIPEPLEVAGEVEAVSLGFDMAEPERIIRDGEKATVREDCLIRLRGTGSRTEEADERLRAWEQREQALRAELRCQANVLENIVRHGAEHAHGIAAAQLARVKSVLEPTDA